MTIHPQNLLISFIWQNEKKKKNDRPINKTKTNKITVIVYYGIKMEFIE